MAAASELPRCFVAVKRVVDYAVKVRVAANRKGVELASVKHSLNPFCEIAVEEAVRMRERKAVGDVTAVSVGPKAAQETLRTALAMGADRAVHIETPADMRTDQDVQPLAVAKLLAWLSRVHLPAGARPDLWLLGKQAIDDDCNQTGQMLAALLDWPQATFASKIELAAGGAREAVVTREVDGGLQTLRVPLPCVFTADLRLNEPRYAQIQKIIQAKKKPLEVIDAKSTGVDFAPRLTVLSVAEPPARKGGRVVKSVDELLSALKNEAGVI
jgi:electron transfer flavoprotein beta subunit